MSEIYTATLQGGNIALPDYEATSLSELKTKIATDYFNSDKLACISLKAVSYSDDLADNQDKESYVYEHALDKIEREIEGLIQELYNRDDVSYARPVIL